MNTEQGEEERTIVGAPSDSRGGPSAAWSREPAAERPAGTTVLYDDEGKPIREVEVPPDAERSVAARLEETARAAPPEERSLAGVLAPPLERTIELREEQLVPQKELRELGEVLVRTQVEEAPGRLEVEAYREEVEVEHEPAGRSAAGSPVRAGDGALREPEGAPVAFCSAPRCSAFIGSITSGRRSS